MKVENFLEKFKGLFDEGDISAVTMDTHFKQIDEWSSMVALFFIAMADEEYGVTITGNDIRAATTVKDLYNVVHSKV